MGGRPAGARNRNVLNGMCKSFEGMWPKSVLRNVGGHPPGYRRGVPTTAGKYGSRYIYLGHLLRKILHKFPGEPLARAARTDSNIKFV